FGGVHALSDVSLAVDAGQIVGVIGPNGAGKTTLLNVICGVSRPDRGDVTLHGTIITGWKPSRIAGLGLGRTFQTSQLFPGMTVPRVAELDTLLRRIRDERGVTLVMIEHVIRLVMGVSDRVIVMNSGRKIAEGRPDDIRRNPDVIEAYLGRQGDARRPAP